MADTPRTAAPQSSGLNRLLMWPAMTLAFVLIPWMATMVVADSTRMSFNEAADLVAAWSLIEDAGPNVEMTVGFSFLAVIATIVIGVAFSLPADGVWRLPKKTRDLVEFLTVTLSLFSAMVLWVIFRRDATLRRIRRADAWHAAVQREFGEEEAQPSPEAPRREPLIWIEIFRRRK